MITTIVNFVSEQFPSGVVLVSMKGKCVIIGALIKHNYDHISTSSPLHNRHFSMLAAILCLQLSYLVPLH
ncbi:hypothetical protein ANPL_02060 [Anaplasma platys]|uniref:Uncharacterized protein n=1 Tax=Anaplasma platys TaxID=949 RepID=A0A858PY56_9RICK|nr:hypothetical protein ANPL_02060 [Anaplasma platys]